MPDGARGIARGVRSRHAPAHREAFLHDVGKIGIADDILRKPGPLTPEEFAVMRTHVAFEADAIPLNARIFAVAGVFDALAAAVYREIWDGDDVRLRDTLRVLVARHFQVSEEEGASA